LLIVVSKRLQPQETSGYESELQLKVDDSFYDESVGIVYSNDMSYVLHIRGKTDTPIKAKPINTMINMIGPSPTPNDSAEIVYAASTLDAAAMKSSLESPDPTIRRGAQLYLAKLGPDALPFIDNAIADTKSSPALQLGALNALNFMDYPSESHLGGKALANIINLTTTSANADIAKSAATYIAKKNPLSIHQAIESWLISNQNRGIRLSDIALRDMDLLYDFGIKTKDAYRRTRDLASFTSAASAFKKGWSDRQFADASDQVYFSKALYGWGLLLADHAALDVDKSGQKNPQLVQAAKDKFREFLRAAEQAPNSPRYPDAEDIKRAQAYLRNASIQL
jgi:hypothetical protein